MSPSNVCRRIVNPTDLREALDTLKGKSYRLREMHDANELLDTIYDCINQAEAIMRPSSSSLSVVDAVFGLRVREAVHCPACRKVTHEVRSHVEHMLVVSATALRAVRLSEGGNATLGQLLRVVQDQDQKKCDTEKGGCSCPQVPVMLGCFVVTACCAFGLVVVCMLTQGLLASMRPTQ